MSCSRKCEVCWLASWTSDCTFWTLCCCTGTNTSPAPGYRQLLPGRSRYNYSFAVFRIRFILIRIRTSIVGKIPIRIRSRSNPDPGFWWPKIEINNWKTTIYFSLGLHTSKLQKMPSVLKREHPVWVLQNMKFLHFFPVCGVEVLDVLFEGGRLLGSRIRNPLFGSKDPGPPQDVEHWFIPPVSGLLKEDSF